MQPGDKLDAILGDYVSAMGSDGSCGLDSPLSKAGFRPSLSTMFGGRAGGAAMRSEPPSLSAAWPEQTIARAPAVSPQLQPS